MPHAPIVIVGAGLAGLACATRLVEAGRAVLVLETDDRVGGRVQTDLVAGFQLDRGFQVLLTAYPEARRILDYPALRLHDFWPGTLVRAAGGFHRVVDPFRMPLQMMETLLAPIGTLLDKWRVAQLRHHVMASRHDGSDAAGSPPTLTYLREFGFSETMIDRFFRPFLGGVFLDHQLDTPSRFFEFVFRMFAQGDIAVPAQGMGAIPAQLARRLPPGCLQLNAPVGAVYPDHVVTADGRAISADRVVVATDAAHAAAWRGNTVRPSFRQVTTVYFATSRPPLDEPWLVLNGEGHGPVNTLCVMNRIAEDYAPAGQSLISVSVLDDGGLGDAALSAAILDQMSDWYGPSARQWRWLRTYRIREALPVISGDQRTGPMFPEMPTVMACGDYLESPSIQGALISGRRAADAIVTASGR
ncbi:MAG: FAD-dependent oxidoreductase [Candidatus Sericytochromatia bacterium]|nr:FAD-dependent oxidoreductase [Candidatus Sericytochromatia bacterium]